MKRWTRAGLVVIGAFLFCSVPKAGASAPVISYPPKSETAILYDEAAFGVIAEGTPPLSYEWLKNGAPMAGATNDQIVIEHAQFSDEADYSVIVSNVDGSVTSSVVALTIRLPKAGDVDGSFGIGGMIDGTVRAVVVQPNGKILIGGDFTTVHGALRRGIARLNADGTTDQTFVYQGAGAVGAIALLSDGRIIIGGGSNGIGRLNADGSIDGTFHGYVSGTINSLAIQGDGKIIMGGEFWQTNDTGPYNLARLNSDGTLDTGFASVLDQSGVYVQSVALQADGKILIAGYFSTVDGISRNALARLNSDGSLDTNFADLSITGSGYPNVGCLAVQNDGKILIGGSFVNLNGYARSNLARLNSDGTVDTNFNPSLPTSTSTYLSVKTIVVQSDGKVVAGGDFTRLFNGANDTYNLTRFNADGTTDNTLFPSINGGVYAVAIEPDGNMVIGGSFTSVQGVGRAYVARMADDALDAGFQNESMGPDGEALSIFLDGAGGILISGFFDQVNGMGRPGIARLNPDGTLDGFSPYIYSSGGKAQIYCVAPAGSGVLVGGNFQFPSDRITRKLGLLNGDGSPVAGFGIFGGQAQLVSAIAVQSNSTAYAALSSQDYYGQLSVQLYRLPLNGDQFSYFGPPFPAFSDVFCLAFEPDGKLLVGGYYTNSNCISLVRLNPDGTVDNGFQCAVLDGNFPGEVRRMAVQPDGKIIIGGFFTQVDGSSNYQSIARLNIDGSLDTSFSSPFIYSSEVYAIALQDDGKILVGSEGLQRLNTDGSVDESFQGFSPDGMVPDTSAIAVQPDGKILVSSGMSAIHGVPTGYIARLWGKDFPPVLKNLVRTETNVCLTWHAISNHTYRVQYSENFTGDDWKDLAGDVCATNDVAEKTDASCGEAKQRFYRVMQLP